MENLKDNFEELFSRVYFHGEDLTYRQTAVSWQSFRNLQAGIKTDQSVSVKLFDSEIGEHTAQLFNVLNVQQIDNSTLFGVSSVGASSPGLTEFIIAEGAIEMPGGAKGPRELKYISFVVDIEPVPESDNMVDVRS